MSKQVVLTIGDTHFADVNYGRHKDFASDCETMMERVATAVEEYYKTLGEKFYRIVILGDFADTRFSHLEFRLSVERFLDRLNACAEKVYCLKGNHDEASGLMTELDYYIGRGVIAKHPEEEEIGGKKVRYVDYVRDPEECAQAHEGADVEVIFTHNALAAGTNTLFSSVDVSKLDAPKLRVGVMGHIHGEMYFKAHNRHGQDVSILDGGAACVRSAERKDVKSFNLLTLHFDGETGKIGSKKIPVNYVEDAFVDVATQEDGTKWSVDSENANIDFTVSGAGSMDIDDLTTQLGKTASPEVISAVKMLFQKYGKVDMQEEEGVAEAAADDDLLDDITNMFKSAGSTPAIETDFDAAEAGLLEFDTSDNAGFVNIADALEEDGILDDLKEATEVGEAEDAGIDALMDDEGTDAESDGLDDLFDGVSEDDDDEAIAVEDLLSEEDKECLRSGAVGAVEIEGGIRVEYRNGSFVFAD